MVRRTATPETAVTAEQLRPADSDATQPLNGGLSVEWAGELLYGKDEPTTVELSKSVLFLELTVLFWLAVVVGCIRGHVRRYKRLHVTASEGYSDDGDCRDRLNDES